MKSKFAELHPAAGQGSLPSGESHFQHEYIRGLNPKEIKRAAAPATLRSSGGSATAQERGSHLAITRKHFRRLRGVCCRRVGHLYALLARPGARGSRCQVVSTYIEIVHTLEHSGKKAVSILERFSKERAANT